MSRYIKILTNLVGGVYLCFGIVAFLSSAMFLLYAPKSDLASAPSLIYLGSRILIFGPCFLIAYACIRGKKWGRYLLIAYNGLWLTYLIFALVAGMVADPKPVASWLVTSFLVIFIVLGSLIAFAFQKDVRALMSH
jgi:hypothetical protein